MIINGGPWYVFSLSVLKALAILDVSLFTVVFLDLQVCGPEKQAEGLSNLAVYYADICGSCHGKLGQDGIAPFQINSRSSGAKYMLDKFIDTDMSPYGPGSCKESCSRLMAESISEVLK